MSDTVATPNILDLRWFGEAVNALCRSVDDLRRHAATELGISASGLDALALICHGEDVTPGDIAAELNITSGSVTPIVDQLVEAGYVERAPHSTDRRRVVLIAKPGGQHALAWALEQPAAELQTIVTGLSERDAAAAAHFLAAATEAFQRRLSAADPAGI